MVFNQHLGGAYYNNDSDVMYLCIEITNGQTVFILGSHTICIAHRANMHYLFCLHCLQCLFSRTLIFTGFLIL